jgi:hypothetical protein
MRHQSLARMSRGEILVDVETLREMIADDELDGHVDRADRR